MKEAGLSNWKFTDPRQIRAKMAKFFERYSVKGFNTASEDYMNEH